MFWIAWPRARPGRPNTRGESLILSSEYYIGRGGGLGRAIVADQWAGRVVVTALWDSVYKSHST